MSLLNGWQKNLPKKYGEKNIENDSSIYSRYNITRMSCKASRGSGLPKGSVREVKRGGSTGMNRKPPIREITRNTNMSGLKMVN